MKSPTVSVLIATHNNANSLLACLDSVANQSGPDFKLLEIIVVDDGSADETAPLLKAWQKANPEHTITILSNTTRLGQTRALNLGLKQVRGTWVARLDADDIWLPNKLELQMAWLQNHATYGVLGSWYTNVRPGLTQQISLPSTDHDIKKSIWRRNPFGHSCVVIKTDLLKQVGGYDNSLRYAQDRDLWFRLMPLTNFHNLPVTLVTRRLDQIANDKQREQMLINIRLIRKYAKLYRASPTV